jgi:hypothetical protein
MSDPDDETLSRDPVRISDDTSIKDVVPEMRERLEALMDLYGCDASLEGWRKLALTLAMAHEPAFRVETPADRTGASGLGGRPIGMKRFHIRSVATKYFNAGLGVRESARRTAKDLDMEFGTVLSAFYDKGSGSDDMRRHMYLHTARTALEDAADQVFQE